MKKIVRNAAILAFGFGMAMSLTACHSSSDSVPMKETVLETKVISGTVVNFKGQAIANATVNVYSGKSLVATATTDNDGFYIVKVSNNGPFSVQASATDYVTKIVNDVRLEDNVADQPFVLAKASNQKVVESSPQPIRVEVVTESVLENSAQANVAEVKFATTIPAGVIPTGKHITFRPIYDKTDVLATRASVTRDVMYGGLLWDADFDLEFDDPLPIEIYVPAQMQDYVTTQVYEYASNKWTTVTPVKDKVKEVMTITIQKMGAIALFMSVTQDVQNATEALSFNNPVASNNSSSPMRVMTIPYTHKIGTQMSLPYDLHPVACFLEEVMVREMGGVASTEPKLKTSQFPILRTIAAGSFLTAAGYQRYTQVTWSAGSGQDKKTVEARRYNACTVTVTLHTPENIHNGGSN
jgi:hypothetical protein